MKIKLIFTSLILGFCFTTNLKATDLFSKKTEQEDSNQIITDYGKVGTIIHSL